MNELIVTVDKCVMAQHDYTTARLNSGDCKFEQVADNADLIVLKTGLDSCGTILDFGDDAITYKVNEHESFRKPFNFSSEHYDRQSWLH